MQANTTTSNTSSTTQIGSTANTPPEKKRSRFGCGKFGCLFGLVLLLAAAGFGYWKYYYTYSSGTRYGLLQKFSHKGNIFKTYEGELILSSVRGNNNVPVASEKFYFTVTKKTIADQLMTAQGRNVTLFYQEKNGALPWRGDYSYIVDSVRIE